MWHSIREAARSHGHLFSGKSSAIEHAKILAEALISERGEAAGVVVAQELQDSYKQLDESGRLEFYQFLVNQFLPEESSLRAAAAAYLETANPQRAAKLMQAAESPRQELLRRWNMAPAGTSFLVEMRKELINKYRRDADLQPLISDLHHLMSSWFNPGFLELRQINWRTPAIILEKLIKYEAVHEIAGWDDLRRRLADDRRCFAFFHPALPDEPLIFVEVALTQGLATSVQALLSDDASKPKRFDTAIFYSISNCQQGLRGIPFGNFLIKHVVQELKAELPNLARFATLSPIPGFRHWFESTFTKQASLDLYKILSEKEQKVLLQAADNATNGNLSDAISQLIQSDDWQNDKAKSAALRIPLQRLCAIYLTTFSEKGWPLDAVANFHLRNGARIEQINWLANTSPRGMMESYGLMTNYLYDLGAIEVNHENFVTEKIIARSRAVDALLKY